MRKTVLISFLVVAATISVYAASIFSEVTAVPGTNQVHLSWVTKSETNIRQFVILRSNDDKHYVEIKRLAAKGPGTRYEYVDQNVMFKDISPLFYKIRALDRAGNIMDESSLFVHPQISGIFRTWGTIKALFR